MINDDIASKDKTIVKFLVGAVIVNNPQLRLFRNKLGPLTWISKRDSRRFEFLSSTVDEEESRNWHRTMATILPLFAVLSKRRTRSAKMGKIERIATWVEIAIDHEFLHSLRISIPLLRKARLVHSAYDPRAARVDLPRTAIRRSSIVHLDYLSTLFIFVCSLHERDLASD